MLMERFGATETFIPCKDSLKVHSDLQESPGSHVCEFVNTCANSGKHVNTHMRIHSLSHTHTYTPPKREVLENRLRNHNLCRGQVEGKE